MKRAGLPLLLLGLATLLMIPRASGGREPDRSRRFRFHYAGAISGVEPGRTARIWIPIAESNAQQTITRFQSELPGSSRLARDPDYGNLILYFEAQADSDGRIPFHLRYDVTRRPIEPGAGPPIRGSVKRYLAANRRVPVGGIVERFFASPPTAQDAELVDLLYETVDRHMRYSKPPNAGWGLGDTLWACDSGFGNCTDFHSLFISLCRELSVPARFEIGFPIAPEANEGKVAGYHCWAAAAVGLRWHPVDISEADKHPEKREFFNGALDADRVQFTVGRDLKLRPQAQAKRVNFLIYPHVEVDGQVHTGLKKGFRFEALRPSE